MKSNQSGFSLIELLVVCGIIGVLASLAIPNYFFAKRNALNASAAADMRNILPAAEAISAKEETVANTTYGFGPSGGDIPGLEGSGPRTTPGVLGTVVIGPNLYEVEAAHVSGSICYSYYTTRPNTYLAEPLPGSC